MSYREGSDLLAPSAAPAQRALQLKKGGGKGKGKADSGDKGATQQVRQYTLGDLGKASGSLDGHESYVQERIDAWNAGEKKRFGGHKGVGGAWTMDVPLLSGGGGRGDARLTFTDAGLSIVNHKGKKIF
jgi:hypothetical protein